MSQLIQIILILFYLIGIFVFTDQTTYTFSIHTLKIHPILIALISICFGIFISLIALRNYKKYLKCTTKAKSAEAEKVINNSKSDDSEKL